MVQLFVFNLPIHATKEDLFALLGIFFKVFYHTDHHDKNPRNNDYPRSRQYATASVATEEEAAALKDKFDGIVWRGRLLRVCLTTDVKEELMYQLCLSVRHFHPTVLSEDWLYDLFTSELHTLGICGATDKRCHILDVRICMSSQKPSLVFVAFQRHDVAAQFIAAHAHSSNHCMRRESPYLLHIEHDGVRPTYGFRDRYMELILPPPATTIPTTRKTAPVPPTMVSAPAPAFDRANTRPVPVPVYVHPPSSMYSTPPVYPTLPMFVPMPPPMHSLPAVFVHHPMELHPPPMYHHLPPPPPAYPVWPMQAYGY